MSNENGARLEVTAAGSCQALMYWRSKTILMVYLGGFRDEFSS
jgi:hypothetical protein